MTGEELINSPKEFNNAIDLYRDLIAGDESTIKRLEALNLDVNAIRTAVQALSSNDKITEQERNQLLTESWRVVYRDRPPTPEEFLTEKYIGPTAKTIYPHIRKVFLEFMDPSKLYRKLILAPYIGYGKAQPKTAQVFTPKGPVPMGDIQIGDIICNSYGSYSRVIGRQEFPEEKVYKLTFNDGRSVLACGNHNWKTSTNVRGISSKKARYDERLWKVRTTEQIIEESKEHPKWRWRFPLTEPAQHEENQHFISPYALGAYLGDGNFDTCCHITGDDIEIHERILKEMPGNYKLTDRTEDKLNKKSSVRYVGKFSREVRTELIRLGLENKKCNDKFIPKEYLYDSIENRIALLQGLLDTDGTVGNNSLKHKKLNYRPHPNFWTTSKQLAEDISELVRGLGGFARTYIVKKGTSGAVNFDAYTLSFSFPEKRFDVFSLPRKQQPITEEYNRVRGYKEKRKPQYLILKSIESVPSMKGGICIETNSDDHCFLTNHYTVTHNSFCTTLVNLYITTCVSLMRDPWRFFGLSPSSVLTQFLCSYSLKKSSELLLEPFNAILESSPFFEKVHARDKMVQANEEYKRMEHIDKIFYTTASPTSELSFAGGCNIKLTSNPTGLLGNTVIAASMSELSFYADAGKALDLNTPILLEDGSAKPMKDISVGDKLFPINNEENVVEKIMWEGEDDLYEIEFDDGRAVRCNLKHLWEVKYNNKEEVVTTQFLLDHPEIEFEIPSL